MTDTRTNRRTSVWGRDPDPGPAPGGEAASSPARGPVKAADRHDWKRRTAGLLRPIWQCRRCEKTTFWSQPQQMLRYDKCPTSNEEAGQ